MKSRIQIERKKAVPFVLILEVNVDILQPIGQVTRVWDALDDEDFSNLDPRTRK